ncbi:hypothetical protein cypCar_00047808 [Cyprinus carpio]|nr:hypothetical protein cypCar_00047808 [Cyprinus carpio]
MYSAFGAPRIYNAPLTSKLTEKQRKKLCDLLGNLELSLLYKASVHGYQASAFHQRCDRQGPTLLVAYNRSGYIFGGYTSVEYAQSGQPITDNHAFLFSVHNGGAPVGIRVKSGHYARYDDAGGPNFGQQLYFCYSNHPLVKIEYNHEAFNFSPFSLYGNDTWLSECEVYKVAKRSTLSEPQVSAEKPWRNVLWTAERRAELMEMIRNYKPLMKSVSRVRILMIGPVGAGKSSFFNSINSIFTGHVTSKAISGSVGTSLTTQFRRYPVKDGCGGRLLPFVLCDTMGLEEQSGAGLDIEDISSILQGHVPDRYKMYQSLGFGSQVSKVAPITCKLPDEKSKRLRALLGNVKLSLLYKASVHGYKASAFHQRCDRRGPTLLVAYNRSGYIFGGYTSVDYAQSGQYITDREAFLLSFQGKIPVCIKINSGHHARLDDAGGPNFGQQLYFCYKNQPVVLNHRGNAFSVNTATMYGNDAQLTECEVYKVKQIPQSSAINKQWRNVLWTANRRAELMGLIRNYKPLMTSFRTYPVVDHHEGRLLPFVLCDTMGLEEQSGAGLDIEDISSILQGHVPDRYKNYSQELELELNCDVLLLTALQQMLNFADDYLDDAGHVEYDF